MSAALLATSAPGIYKRGRRYVVRVRDAAGRQVQRSAATLAEARLVKAELTTRRGRIPAGGNVTFARYVEEWTHTYRGRTGLGIRAATLADYAADLRRYAVPLLGRRRLSELTPADVKVLVASLEDCGLSPARVRNVIAPVRALLATAREDGLILDNPAAGLRLPGRRAEDGREERAKALSPEQLAQLIAATTPGWQRLLVRFVAASGLRIGEAVAVTWASVDFGAGRVRVSERIYRGERGAPKSRYGRREVPLPAELVSDLRRHRLASPFSQPGDPVFATSKGTPHLARNLLRRVLHPAAERAGLIDDEGRSWPGWHTLRHTCASRLLMAGANVAQVQRWLGHHSPSFTLDTYVHLLPADLPDPELLAALVAEPRAAGVNKVSTRARETGRDRDAPGLSNLRD
jgi:integrase